LRAAKRGKYKKDSIIFSENTLGKTLFIVISGQVKIFVEENKRRKILSYLEQGEFFGELALLYKNIRSASAEAMTDCELLILRQNDFKQILKNNPNIALELIKVLCERLRNADKEIESLSFDSVTSRIARGLIELSKKYGKPTELGKQLNLIFSKKEIAEYSGTVREVATRVLNHLHKLGYIDFKDRHIVITNEPKLRSLIK
jgi:CRP/FNR family transcriptional regulator